MVQDTEFILGFFKMTLLSCFVEGLKEHSDGILPEPKTIGTTFLNE